MTWPLPPQLPWPRFLRLLRHPAPPEGWLEAAAGLEEVQRRPVLLRWVAQHPKAPAFLRARLLPRLPWRVLAAIAADASAHPQARAQAVERLLALWPVLTTGERRTLAILAPRPLWPLAWKVPDERVLASFLQNPRLNAEVVSALVQAPLSRAQIEALAASRWFGVVPVAFQVLQALDLTLQRPDPQLVLGQAAPWIRCLEPEERLQVASRLSHPALRRMTRAWAACAPDAGEASGELLDPDLPPQEA